jgi:hypothetical protein
MIMGLFSRISGLQGLIKHYQTDLKPEGPELVRRTVGFGAVKYRNCVTVYICHEGLYLWVRPPFFSHLPILIPWTDIKQTDNTTLYHRAAVEMQVKEPTCKTIIVYQDLFDQFKAFLKS